MEFRGTRTKFMLLNISRAFAIWETFFALRTQLCERFDVSFRVKIYRVRGMHPSLVRWHYMFCHLVTRVAQLRARRLAHERDLPA